MASKIVSGWIAGSLFMLAGCGDGSIEIKTKNNDPPNTVIIEKNRDNHVVVEKPVIIQKDSPSRETSKTTVTTPDGTTRTKETTTVKRYAPTVLSFITRCHWLQALRSQCRREQTDYDTDAPTLQPAPHMAELPQVGLCHFRRRLSKAGYVPSSTFTANLLTSYSSMAPVM